MKVIKIVFVKTILTICASFLNFCLIWKMFRFFSRQKNRVVERPPTVSPLDCDFCIFSQTLKFLSLWKISPFLVVAPKTRNNFLLYSSLSLFRYYFLGIISYFLLYLNFFISLRWFFPALKLLSVFCLLSFLLYLPLAFFLLLLSLTSLLFYNIVFFFHSHFQSV